MSLAVVPDSACSVIFEKQLVNRKLSAVHSAVQIEIFAFRLLLNRRLM